MKKIILVFIIVFTILLSSCALSSSIKDQTKSFEQTDYIGIKILENRKTVYELMEENPDALTTVPKPATHDPVPVESIEGLPDCIIEWAYNYFNCRVTYEIPDYFGYNEEIGTVLRLITAIRRVENKPVDTFELVVPYIESNIINSENHVSVSLVFSCSYKIYDEKIQGYIITDNDRLKVTFYLIKEKDEWIIEDIKNISSEYYNYAVNCMYKTMGRFPEIDAYSKYNIVDFTIYEYTKNLFDFGVISPT